ncbi:MAG: hypothetical protein KGR48_09355 [Alphaproteobacteria bacterium]|nr:hypothetical protein [Alphaproteobacteria bacterium]MBU6473514.1 hypothetical protein [Alphaproteobacteria bacterium]MDE2013528.1 hypothetical protein [Alphaproteobacteria bacterium]MDE2073360.1 hypothetical protein [Alphaproteobacteria bacterium]MDE2351052.1 hypothetical protein [Alphaproteobacteria bacterium]
MSDIGGDVERPAATVNAGDGRGPAHRLVLTVVIALGILILIGLGALVVGVAIKMRGHSGTASPGAAASLALPAGARIESMEVSGNRLILRLKTDAGEEIDLVDTDDGHVVSRLKAAPPDVPSGAP